MQWRSKHTLCFIQVDHHTKLNINAIACSHVVHILQHPALTQQQRQCKIQWSMLWRRRGYHFQWESIWQLENVIHSLTSSRNWRQKLLRSRQGPRQKSILHVTIQNKDYGGAKTINPQLVQWMESIINRELCVYWNWSGKRDSWRSSDSNWASGGRYENCWKGRVDNQKAQNVIWGGTKCYLGQSEWSCKFQECGG